MATDTDNTCRKSLRVMSYHEAVVSLYCRSNGLVFLVAIKTNGIVYINPSDIEIIESNRGNVPTVESHGCIGDCDAIFLISPSWEIAWKILTEEDNLCREGNTRYNLDCRNQDTDDAHKKVWITLRVTVIPMCSLMIKFSLINDIVCRASNCITRMIKML